MAYSSFTYLQLQERFGIGIVTHEGLFRATPPHAATSLLREILERQAPIARDVSTEMARSAMIVAPVLAEIREITEKRIGVFPGVELNVDRKVGLHGFCDFLMGRAEAMIDLQAPLLAVTNKFSKCLAAMYAAQLFNQRRGHPVEATFGVVTSGTAWRFLERRGTSARIDSDEYYIDDLDKILGILVRCVTIS